MPEGYFTHKIRGWGLGFLLFGVLLATTATAQTWGPDVRLSDNGSGTWPAGNNAKAVAVWGDTVYAVWGEGDFEFRSGVSCTGSYDKGKTWNVYCWISENNSFSSSPAIAVYEDNIHVVWSDRIDGSNEIYYRRFNGNDWEPVERLTYGDSASGSPSIAVSGNVVHVVWQYQKGDWDADIYYRRFDGNSWWPSGALSTGTVHMTRGASVASWGNGVHLVWESGDAIHYRHSHDKGVTWDEDTSIVKGSWWVEEPCVTLWEDEVHLVWVDHRKHDWGDVYYKVFDGTSWGPDTPITDSEEETFHPSVAVSGENIHVAWSQYSGGYEVFYRRFDGNDWSPAAILTPNDWEDSRFPSIAAQGNDIHLAWMDFRNHTNEIFYKHGTLEGGIEELPPLISDDYYLEASSESEPLIHYGIPKAGKVSLVIADVTGRVVRTLVSGEQSAGYHQVIWDRCDDGGTKLPSGVYFCQLRTQARSIVRKLILLQ